MRFRLGVATLAVGLGLLPSRATPQTEGQVESGGSYAARYGPLQLVELKDLAFSAETYRGRNVRTQGDLNILDTSGGYFSLSDSTAQVLMMPVRDIAGSDLRQLLGRRVEVKGIVRMLESGGGTAARDDPELPPLPNPDEHMGWPRVSITIYSIVDISPSYQKKIVEAQRETLEKLITRPGKRDGQTVRVVGKFRGHNLFGDLPVSSQRRGADWVIKDELFAVWVTGKKPKGSGWELDADLKRDTNKWIEVVGRPETIKGVVYIKAQGVSLTTAPTPTAVAQAPPPLPERPKVPPVVVFALPLDGESSVPPDSRFAIQFSKDMDEGSFREHVLLRYSGPIRPGDRQFEAMKLKYDGGRRALIVDPGDALRPGREVEILLLPGIADIDGLTLVPRPGKEGEIAVDVLRFRVGT